VTCSYNRWCQAIRITNHRYCLRQRCTCKCLKHKIAYFSYSVLSLIVLPVVTTVSLGIIWAQQYISVLSLVGPTGVLRYYLRQLGPTVYIGIIFGWAHRCASVLSSVGPTGVYRYYLQLGPPACIGIIFHSLAGPTGMHRYCLSWYSRAHPYDSGLSLIV
jgi:hypothetical protein